MSQALCFNEITFSPVTHQNSLWIRAAELARALGFTREDKVAQIYQRHADEFTPDMTQLIEIVAEPQNEVPGNMGAGRCRIFSLRGCHLLAMFARTPVAKQFRHWVLDVLDKLAEEERAKTKPVENPDKSPTPDAPLTPDQQCTLQAIVRAKVEALPREQRGGLYPKTWSRFNNHFRLAKYCQLPQSRLSEAVAYLTQLDMTEGKQALPTATPALSPAPEFAFRTDFPTDMHTGRKDALRKIQSLMAGVGAARDVVRLFCHPGGKSMRMTLDEREIYDALYQLYCAADDSLLAAYRALDAGYKIGRQYGRG